MPSNKAYHFLIEKVAVEFCWVLTTTNFQNAFHADIKIDRWAAIGWEMGAANRVCMCVCARMQCGFYGCGINNKTKPNQTETRIKITTKTDRQTNTVYKQNVCSFGSRKRIKKPQTYTAYTTQHHQRHKLKILRLQLLITNETMNDARCVYFWAHIRGLWLFWEKWRAREQKDNNEYESGAHVDACYHIEFGASSI